MSSGRQFVPNINEEVPFSIEELFFSRTDKRGIIASGNSVFQKISQYSWEELLEKPHNLIRHPDMPKAVFWLLWDTIKKGNPIGAYVKNKAKDGRYYWVYAIVTPLDDGYLSVRLKPTSEILKVVEEEYQKLANLETANNLTPEASAGILLNRLNELGFSNYNMFMATTLSKEIAARNNSLHRLQDGAIARFDELVRAANVVLQNASTIFTEYEKNEYVPLNLRVQAAQLGEFGSTINVISYNYNIISTEIKESMSQFIDSSKQVFKSINDGLFLVCTAGIQHEILNFFKSEEEIEGISREHEMQLLAQQQSAYMRRATDSLRSILTQAEQFAADCAIMKRLASGLEVTRIMAKVESARLIEDKNGLGGMIEDLEAFQKTIAINLRDIDNANRSVRTNTQRALHTLQ